MYWVTRRLGGCLVGDCRRCSLTGAPWTSSRVTEGGVSGSDGMQMRSILGAAAVVPAVAGLDVGAQARNLGTSSSSGTNCPLMKLLAVSFVPRVERMPS